jgi:hypothetical protein
MAVNHAPRSEVVSALAEGAPASHLLICATPAKSPSFDVGA